MNRVLIFTLGSHLSLLISRHLEAASFKCEKARNPDEKAICSDHTLNDKDDPGCNLAFIMYKPECSRADPRCPTLPPIYLLQADLTMRCCLGFPLPVPSLYCGASGTSDRGQKMHPPDYPTLLRNVTVLVQRAGQLLSAEWERPSGPRGHGDKAEIDVEIELLLRRDLLALLECDFWGEETGHVLTGHPWCWVLDPNDGTSDFLKGRKGSSIAVGLLHNNLPVLGVVHAPITPEGLPDCIAWAEGLPDIIRNGASVNSDLQHAGFTPESLVMVSFAATAKPTINSELCAPAAFYPMPSIAYRLARVAAGDAQCGVSLFPLSAHDVVAAHALLRGANGTLIDEHGEGIIYDTEAKMLRVAQRCFGGAHSICHELSKRDWSRIFD